MIDSGADVNVVSENHWHIIETQAERGEAFIYDDERITTKRLVAYAANAPLEVVRTFTAWIEVAGGDKPKVFSKFYVIKNGTKNLLGRKTAVDVKVLKLGLSVDLVTVDNQSDNSEPFPAVPNYEVNFEVDEKVQPTQNAYYHVPAAFSNRARERLAEMERRDIIERVTKPSRWVSGMSAVPKGQDDFRLVVNMRGPNRAIRRHYHRLPVIDQMRTKLIGARFFTKLDLSSAFYHLRLSEDSRELTTFMTEDGMYRFKRLVFGVNCAPEIFQRFMEFILEGVKGLIIFIDDILIFAETLEELRERTKLVHDALGWNNLTLNKDKCEYEREKVTFLGHELSASGFSIDEDKVKAVREFRSPRTVSELKSFLGLASYVSTFVPRFADLTADLWSVTARNAFKWGVEQAIAFEATKEAIITNTTKQGFFNDEDDTYLYTDASPTGLGAVLVQVDGNRNPRVISYASKTLSSVERKYPQPHREAYAVVWAIEHFYYFLMGRHFIVRTDAQGIAQAFDRDKTTSRRYLNRVDGWTMRLSCFDFEIEYIKGAHNIADPPSRLSIPLEEDTDSTRWPWEIYVLTGDISNDEPFEFSNDMLTEEEVRESTKTDAELSRVMVAIKTGGWEDSPTPYKRVRDNLTVRHDIIVKDGAMVVPANLRNKALKLAHEGHPGGTAMKSILRARVWWPGLTRDAEAKVEECEECLLMSRSDPPVPMQRSRLPSGPWQDLVVDFNGPHARHGGLYILVVVDCYSRFISFELVKSTDLQSVQRAMNSLFMRYGFPRSIKSDNGPPFNGSDYKYWLRSLGIMMLKSTPLYPQQNGMAERYMQVVNKAMGISSSANTNFAVELQKAAVAHNSAIHRITGFIPEEAMLGRKVRRALPLMQDEKVQIDYEQAAARDATEKNKAKEREDNKRGAKECGILPGDTVVILNTKRAKGDTKFQPEKFNVVEVDRGDLTLLASDGKIFQRNNTQVKKVKIQPPQKPTPNPPNVTRQATEDAQDEGVMQQPHQTGKRQSRAEITSEPRRTTRIAKPPAYLNMYIRMISEN